MFCAAPGAQGGVFQFNGSRAALWRDTALSFVDLSPLGGLASMVLGVSPDCQVGSYEGLGTRAALWRGSAGSFVDLNPLGSLRSTAWACTDDTQCGFFVNSSNVQFACVWTGSAASVLELPQGLNGEARAIAGNSIGGHRGTPPKACFWTGPDWTFHDLHPSKATASVCRGVADIYKVGTAKLKGGNLHAVLWTGNSSNFIDLHEFLPLRRFTSSEARAVQFRVARQATGRWLFTLDIVGTALVAADEVAPIRGGQMGDAVLWRLRGEILPTPKDRVLVKFSPATRNGISSLPVRIPK